MASTLHRASVFAVMLLVAFAGIAADQSAAEQSAAVRDAVAAIGRGDFPAAEKALRAEVQVHSGDPWALSLLGVALDNEKNVSEAEEFHRRAVALSPRSTEILNNYGTHLWIAGLYDRAETVFASALAGAPLYFNLLYNLGVMATYTGHYERACEVLETALRQQPENVDVLYRLAFANEASRQWEAAVILLARAAKLDPRRADVQKLLALTTTELGALDDAAAAWDRYLKLEPGDETARRERGYTAASMGELEKGIADLEWFLARHPDDPVAHYELAQAQRTVDIAQALGHLDKALVIDPNYLPARAARGSLYTQEGKPESALKDLELAASLQPDDAANLDRLGQTYQALDRTADAVRVLRRAAELAPEDSKTLLHFARALADAGQTEASKAVMDRFRQLGPEPKKGVPAGLVEYLSLAPDVRRAEYRARVEKAVHDRPADPAAQVDYLKLELGLVKGQDGNADRVASAVRRLAALKPGGAVLAGAGRALLEAKQYALARELLQQAAAAGLRAGDVQLDLAIATFHATGAATEAAKGASGAKDGLAILDRIPESERSADYYMARAEMLYASGDASGNVDPAATALGQALHAAPNRADLYQRAVALLVRKGRAPEALQRIDEAARTLPENREILLLKATALEFARQSADAEILLNEIQNRWPEWSAVWLAHGIILDTHRHFDPARQALETAVALGARGPETYFYLADCTLQSGAGRKDAAETAISQALKISPRDPWIQALAGRIAFERGEYQLAVERLRAAIHERPGFVEAHKRLAQVYAALGRKPEAEAELKQIATMPQAPPGADDRPPYLGSLFEGSLIGSNQARQW